MAPTPRLTLTSHWRLTLALLVTLLAALTTRAQGPAWDGAAVGSTSQVYGNSQTYAVATDASGNVLVTGSFSGTVAFGGTVLTSAGGDDLFVAKYVPASSSWSWAQRAGGTGYDYGYGIAVAGASVYVTGTIFNNTSNAYAVTFGSSTVNGATATLSRDVVLAKYTDNGASATLGWTQIAGGTNNDQGNGVAVNGSSVYVTGSIINTTGNARGVVFGGTGTAPGTVPVNGASATSSSDVVLAKYTDNGSSATLGWVQVAGGSGLDESNAVAVSGSSVYVTGYITNNNSNASGVVFGSDGTAPGTVPVNGAGSMFSPSYDLVLAKYTDNGSTGALGWTQVGGGGGSDQGNGIAVSGASVYVTGSIINNATNTNTVTFGGGGTVAGSNRVAGASATTGSDLILVKYQDSGSTGSYGWSQVGGGTGNDSGKAVAVNGPSVYVTGYVVNNAANANAVLFGGSGVTVGTIPVNGGSVASSDDAVLAKYTDQGSTGALGWTQVGGGTSSDQGHAVAVSGSNVYVAGYLYQGRSHGFGGADATQLQGTFNYRSVVAAASDGGNTGRWTSVAASFNGGFGVVQAIATDAAGSVFAAGSFTGQVVFGSTVLSSMGDNDLFVAKYVPATRQWAWAQRGGGTLGALGSGIAVSGSSIYVATGISNNASNANAVSFGGTSPANSLRQVNGASSALSADIVLAKYTDNGSSATLGWVQVAGGSGFDRGTAVAVSGPSVYVVGSIINNTANANAVVFGGDGTTPGTVPVNGASPTLSNDLVLAKYTDNGSSATLGWTQVGGGTGEEGAQGVAVSGTSVYMTGIINNNVNNFARVVFGGGGTTAGTTQVNGASFFGTLDTDVVLAKYTDQGSTATLGWTQVAGGSGSDQATAVAVSGARVYLTGMLQNDLANTFNVLFGGGGTTPGTRPQRGATATMGYDMMLAKYTDNGATATFGWSQVAGGTGVDRSLGVAASGSNVYVTGSLVNNASNNNAVVFGGAGLAPGTTLLPGAAAATGADLVLAKYTDNGGASTFAWAQLGGGPGNDVGYGVAVSGQQVFAGGELQPGSIFGPTTLTVPTSRSLTGLAYLTDVTLPLLATRSTVAGIRQALYPNPTTGKATLALAGLREQDPVPVEVVNVLGQAVQRYTARPKQGVLTEALNLSGLPTGIYTVRIHAQEGTVVKRLVKE